MAVTTMAVRPGHTRMRTPRIALTSPLTPRAVRMPLTVRIVPELVLTKVPLVVSDARPRSGDRAGGVGRRRACATDDDQRAELLPANQGKITPAVTPAITRSARARGWAGAASGVAGPTRPVPGRRAPPSGTRSRPTAAGGPGRRAARTARTRRPPRGRTGRGRRPRRAGRRRSRPARR